MNALRVFFLCYFFTFFSLHASANVSRQVVFRGVVPSAVPERVEFNIKNNKIFYKNSHNNTLYAMALPKYKAQGEFSYVASPYKKVKILTVNI